VTRSVRSSSRSGPAMKGPYPHTPVSRQDVFASCGQPEPREALRAPGRAFPARARSR
jgi:hypothetical protein